MGLLLELANRLLAPVSKFAPGVLIPFRTGRFLPWVGEHSQQESEMLQRSVNARPGLFEPLVSKSLPMGCSASLAEQGAAHRAPPETSSKAEQLTTSPAEKPPHWMPETPREEKLGAFPRKKGGPPGQGMKGSLETGQGARASAKPGQGGGVRRKAGFSTGGGGPRNRASEC